MNTPSPALIQQGVLWYSLATIVGSAIGGGLIGTIVTLWVNRGKPAADIHETRGRAAREFAEANEIRIRANFTLEDETIQRTQQMMQAQRHIFELQNKNRDLQDEVRELRTNQRKQISR